MQAMIEVDRLLAERLQARELKELTDEEKAILFVELLEKRKKHFAELRAQEKRNKPPTKHKRKVQCQLSLNTMVWFTIKSQLNNKSICRNSSYLEKADDKDQQEKSYEQEVAKKQENGRMTERKEDLINAIKIVQDDEVAIDVIPLATKPTPILIKSFDREDLKNLWKLVKAKHGK
ncbi:hypothetical protein Tco_0994658 [Tanacetum coccineum]